MNEEFNSLWEKIDTHFKKFNTKFDAHEKKEWKLFDHVVKRLDIADSKLIKLEKDVSANRWLFTLTAIAIVILFFKIIY